MLDPTSRYAQIATARLMRLDVDGQPRLLSYLRRRLIPPADQALTVAEHTVAAGERLDTITARYLGDPTAFWRLCDANEVLRPTELTDEIGHRIAVALPRL
jgi:hypothetical protein